MELVKNNVYLRNKAGQAANKMYVNEEVNVSEVFPEIYNIVREKTEIQLDKITPETDQVILNGYINYNILYFYLLYSTLSSIFLHKHIIRTETPTVQPINGSPITKEGTPVAKIHTRILEIIPGVATNSTHSI